MAGLGDVQSSAAELSQVIQHGLDGPAGQIRVQNVTEKTKTALQELSRGKSQVEDYPDMGDDVQKKASQQFAVQISQSFVQFAQAIANARESFSSDISSQLKSVLEEFEEVEQSYSELTKANGGNIGDYIPGLSHMLEENVNNAFDKVGGR
ncbi:hypothetical protein FSARC_14736 [Fusarium sarcochroum]|uniref:Uncharacterized protein n=1 Tax=Fusarium sarcochroum TaxID=1208366 RepID=A0A8H4WNJ0_9HYPO|nr:hypothetical protein FSARC_14736 [Fusarium sarcochroum]